MGSSEKNINIKIAANTESAAKGIDEITKKLNKFEKESKSKLSTFAKFGSAISGVGLALSTVKKAFSSATAAISSTVNATLKQEKAEILLQTAAENNPYLSSKNVKALKEYASQLQSISTVGDEELLPFMAQLAAAGRTQTEIQNIMSAALDVSASGAMSLDSAVKNLNKTYSGLSGELGETVPQIKQLTEEQLKSGEAVKIVAEQYKGMSKETADSVGFMEKFKNSAGDLLERVGEIFVPAARIIVGAFSKIIEAANNAYDVLTQKNNFADATGLELEEEITKKTIETLKQRNDARKKALEQSIQDSEKRIEKARRRRGSEDYIKELQDGIDLMKKEILNGEEEVAAKEKELLNLQEQINEKKKKAAELQKAEKQENEAEKAKKAFDETIAGFEKEIKYRRQTGEVISEEKEKQEKLNQLIASYINMRKSAPGITDDDEKVVEILEKIKKLSDELNFSIPKMPALNNLGQQEQITALESYRQLLLELKTTVDEDTKAWNALEKAIKGVDEQLGLLKNTTDGWDAMKTSEKAEYVQQKFTELGNGVNSALSTTSEALQNQASADMQNLENQYNKGLISEEEYYAKKEEMEKKSAQDLYKVQLAEWGLNLLMTQSQMALAIAKALSSGTPPLSYVNAAIMGVSAGAQLAAQIAAKPVPPSFASGGIVPGTSYTGDKVSANVNSGEMILNSRQQRELWETANGGTHGRPVFNISIENSASDVAGAEVTPSADGFTVAIKKIVKDAMANGEMNDSYQTMKANIYGRRITN